MIQITRRDFLSHPSKAAIHISRKVIPMNRKTQVLTRL